MAIVHLQIYTITRANQTEFDQLSKNTVQAPQFSRDSNDFWMIQSFHQYLIKQKEHFLSSCAYEGAGRYILAPCCYASVFDFSLWLLPCKLVKDLHV